MSWASSDRFWASRGGGARKVGGVSIFSLILALIVWKVFGISPETTLGVTEQITQNNQSAQAPAQETADQAETREFVARVLALDANFRAARWYLSGA